MSTRIAAIVLAYRYSSGISALSRFFDAADTDMFVHVDAKVDDSPFRDAAKNSLREIIFVENRVRIFWRGFTMVEAMITLMKSARAHRSYDGYVIISDDSLPLVRPSDFRSRLECDGDVIAAAPANDALKLRYERFFMFDSAATQVRWTPVIDREVTQDALQRFAQLSAVRRRGKKPLTSIFHGSQWMALTSASVDKILTSWENDSWLRESFEFSEVPDESYFHTILSQQGVPQCRPLVHAEWSTPSPPRIFKTPEELFGIDAGVALFVRKVDFEPHDLDVWMNRLITS